MKSLYTLILVLSVTFASCDNSTDNKSTKKSSSSRGQTTEGEKKNGGGAGSEDPTVEEKKNATKPTRPADKTALATEIDRAMKAQGNDVDLNYIDTSAITNMSKLFMADNPDTVTVEGYGLGAFEGNISKWNVSRVTKMNSMFLNATNFNSDISMWDVSRVTKMNSMFSGATKFNRDISKWNVSAVTTMGAMFYGATQFNSDISKWNVSAVTTMTSMFLGAIAFNRDISGWQVQNVTRMNSMFHGATVFKQNLDAWGSRLHRDIKGSTLSTLFMFKNSGLKDSLPNWCKNTLCKNEL